MAIRFASLATLAMLIFAPTNLLAQNAFLTVSQQKNLSALIAARGHAVTLNKDVTLVLGLTKSGEAMTVRELTVNLHPGIRAYMALPDGGILLIYYDGTINNFVYR